MVAPEFDLGGSNLSLSGNATVTGTKKFSQSPVADPLALLAVPDSTTMTVRSASAMSISGTTTLNPGVYVGGISMSGNAVVTMNPGVYYMKTGASGKGFTVSGNATVTGNQVTIYNEAVNSAEVFSISGNGAVTLTPPTTGTYTSILYFQSRTSARAASITGNGQLKMSGDLYLKGATLNISGNGSNIGSLNVANKLVVSGNGNISVNNF